MWHKVKVHPWIGEYFMTPKIFPHRTLILGESNYTSPDKFNSALVISCIQDHIGDNTDPNFSRFATKVRRVIFGRETSISAKEFWENAAFYNFVQYLVGGESKERPTSQMWFDSVEAFSELVTTLKPERVLILGQENWRNLLGHIEHIKINENIANLVVGGSNVLAGYILHPSYGGGFTYKEWHPVAESVLLKHNE